MQSQHCTSTLVIRRSLFVVLLILAACDLLTAPSVATTIRLSPAELVFDALGENLRVTATVEDQSGNVMSNDTITWTASDRGIATVSFS
ncbi:MAG TPA: Ig-like domain-containing protein, partial [Gemmatimonadetes bacterium]|nr:Ig-like domain-containing protein [Gemmatimonadota bacterium]